MIIDKHLFSPILKVKSCTVHVHVYTIGDAFGEDAKTSENELYQQTDK